MNPIKKLAGETAIYGIPTIIGRFINWLLVPLYTNVFPNSEYGIVINLMAYTAIFLVLLTYGMETGYFRFASRENPEKVFSTIMTSVLSTTFLFFLFIFIFTGNIFNFIEVGGTREYIVLLALTIGLDAICSIPFAKLRLEGRPGRFALIKSLNIGLNVFLNVLFLIILRWVEDNFKIDIPFYDFSYGIGYIFVSYFIASLVTLFLLLPEFRSVKFTFSKSLYKRIIVYSFPILIVSIAGMINLNIDKILLPKLLDSERAVAITGIYGANYKLALLMYLFVQAFKFAFEPFFFSKYRSDDSKEVYAKIFNYFAGFGLLIFLGVMFYLDILKYFINENYHSGLNILPWVLMANLFQGLYYSLSLWYKLSDKTIIGAYMAIGGAVVTLVMNIILIPRIGYMGCAYAVVCGFLCITVYSYLLGRKYFRVDYKIGKVSFYFVFALALYGISKYFVIDNIWLKMLAKTPLIVLYAVVFIVTEKLYLIKK